MTDTDSGVLAALEHPCEVAAPALGERGERQRSFLADVRHHLAERQPEAIAQAVLERDAGSHFAVDEHAHQSVAGGPRDQAVGPGRRQAETRGHGALGQTARVVQPSGASGRLVVGSAA